MKKSLIKSYELQNIRLNYESAHANRSMKNKQHFACIDYFI